MSGCLFLNDRAVAHLVAALEVYEAMREGAPDYVTKIATQDGMFTLMDSDELEQMARSLLEHTGVVVDPSWIDEQEATKAALAERGIPNPSSATIAEAEATQEGMRFFPLYNEEDWANFWASNSEALIADLSEKAANSGLTTEQLCRRLAQNCELFIGGGAAPIFRVGFVD